MDCYMLFFMLMNSLHLISVSKVECDLCSTIQSKVYGNFLKKVVNYYIAKYYEIPWVLISALKLDIVLYTSIIRTEALLHNLAG